MSSHELKRVEVIGRVKNGELKLIDAAVILELSYRQVKRLWQRYREAGRQGLKHGNVGRPSNRRKPLKFAAPGFALDPKEVFPGRRRSDSGQPWQPST